MNDERDPDLDSALADMHRATAVARARKSERIVRQDYFNGPCTLCRHWPADEYAFREVRWVDDKNVRRTLVEPCPWVYCPYVEGEEYQGIQGDFDPPKVDRRGVAVSMAAWKAAVRLRYRMESEEVFTETEED